LDAALVIRCEPGDVSIHHETVEALTATELNTTFVEFVEKLLHQPGLVLVFLGPCPRVALIGSGRRPRRSDYCT
jgi:hypothetical protein